MIRYAVHIDEAQARFTSLGVQAAGYERILKRWGGYFKSQALKRAETAEGWAPLAEATKKRLQQTRRSNITTHGKVRASYGSALERHLIREQAKQEARSQYGALAGSTNAAKRLSGTSSVRAAVRGSASEDLQELRRLQAGGRVERARTKSGKLSARAEKWTGSKAIGRLRGRLAKAQAQQDKGQRASVGGDKRKSDGHQLLGRVARQIQWRQEGTRVSIFSKIPWSEIHNAGGTAGHGANEPERRFLEITDADQTILSQIVLDHLMGGA